MPRDEVWRAEKQRRYRELKNRGATSTQASNGCSSDQNMARVLAILQGTPAPPPKLCKRCEVAPVHSSHGACVLCLECAHEARSVRVGGHGPKARGHAMSLEEIARELGCSDARVGQILDSALEKLREIAPTYLRELMNSFEH